MPSTEITSAFESLADPSRVRPVEVHHVNFKTRRLEAMRDWYAELLGAEVVYENGLVCFLTYDGGHHRIALLGNPDLEPGDPGNEGFEHVAFLYASLDDLLACWRQAGSRGVAPFWTTNHGPSISFYYRDPDSNTVELQADRFNSLEKVARWFESGDFDANPIGVDVDPDRLLQARRAGVGSEDLFERSRNGEFE